MATTKYTKMAYGSADEMVFGTAKQPVAYGFGIKVGAGRVIPELNYGPRPGSEKDPARLKKEYVDYISKDALNRAVTLGFPDLQLETEWISQMGNPKMSTPVVEGQKEICEKFHEEYGINCAVRHTIPDQREAEEGLRTGMGGHHGYPEALFKAAEVACENGADVLSCETMGGKELADYATTNGDIVAFLFGVGYLGA
ncbi:MAG: methanol--corrinoid methyltransferase, partial [Candidatus Methanomethylophilaceae archaeon]|nr:methanol--corrinoid methyltransferase [Candidatus Methanomethylophilaceae archaeon]